MQIGALGDIHGEFDVVQDILARHADVSLWVQVGDIASNDGDYFTPSPSDLLDQGQQRRLRCHRRRHRGRPPAPTLHYLANGGRTPSDHGGCGAGGTFAPSWYHTPVASLPPSRVGAPGASGASVKLGKSRDDKRRHFVRYEVLACKALTSIDVFLTHEAPRPFYPAGTPDRLRKTVINEVIASLKPRLHLFGTITSSPTRCARGSARSASTW
jgi:hypothetical protein